jgi:hypothetical protein
VGKMGFALLGIAYLVLGVIAAVKPLARVT